MVLLSRGAGLVGTFSSGYSKRVFELQAARQQAPFQLRYPPEIMFLLKLILLETSHF
jgi:hypothetical protein